MFVFVVTRATAIMAAVTATVSLIVVPVLGTPMIAFGPLARTTTIDPGYIRPFVVYGGTAAAVLGAVALVFGLIEYYDGR
jgi:hypothetical protein